jgi:predicted Fe-S protein YdhL (DUF1289 family)
MLRNWSSTEARVTVASPCRNICRMHEPSGVCVGCGRTLDEIALWSVLDDDDKRAVWVELGQRRVVWRQRRGAAPSGEAAP